MNCLERNALNKTVFRSGFWLLAIALMLAAQAARAADFNVTSPGVYNINGIDNNPPITLMRGQTYTFDINTAADHPFEIVSDATFPGTPYNNGVINNNISTGTITFAVPLDAPDTLFYICSIHFFGGTINIVNGNNPATVSITSPTNGAIFFGTNPIVVAATATDSDGSVTNVEFFDGAVSLGSDTTSPYSVTNVFANGTHTITAVAKDDSGNSTTSAAIMFNVGAIITNPILERIGKGDIMIELQTVADGMAAPVGSASPNDGTGRHFVYDQSGIIWVVTPSGRLATPMLDIRARLNPAARYDYDERGLLGLAVHPGFSTNKLLYTYTSETNGAAADFPTTGTNRNHQSVITEWKIDPANTNRIDVTSRREVMRVDKPQSNHNGGTMRFGPDGFLYITIGDGGAANDVADGHVPGGNGQYTNTVLGKILRIDVNTRDSDNGQYGLPVDNPFDGVNGLREIYAYGLRNPFSFSFDKVQGTLWLGDVGQNRIEEIDIITNGGNYGWNIREGTNWFDSATGNLVTAPTRPVPPDLIDPIAVYDHDDGLAVVGGFVYRGTLIPALQGKYVFADWGSFGAPSGRLFYLETNYVIKELRIGLRDRPLGHWVRGFGEGPDGELYVFGSRIVGPAGNTGKMLKLIPSPNPISLTVRRGTNDVICGIAGGQGPFALQKKSTLANPTWLNTRVAMQTSLVSTTDTSMGIFRVTDTANQAPIPLSAMLSGAAERPTPLVNSSTGFALMSLEGNTLIFNIRYSGLSGNGSAAHIHGPATAAGAAGVIIDLAPHNGGSFGASGAISGQIIISDTHKAMILAGQTYVNVHTVANGGGETRGQIAPVLYQAALNGANERPTPNDKPSTGLGLFSLVGNQLTFNVTYRGLSGPATAAHIHGPATMDVPAGIMIDLQPYNGGGFGTNGTLAGTVTLTAAQLAALVDGLTYVNVHTVAHGGGEIRGQIVPQVTAIPFTAPLTGLSERPTPLTNSAAGSAFLSLEGDVLAFSINYSNLSGPATLAHIHGPATSAQFTGIQVDLAPYNGGAFGTNGTFMGTVLLTTNQRAMLLNGQTYVNVHTAANPAGEMRGQVAPVFMRSYLSGAEERPNPILSPGSALGSFALVLNQLSFNVTYRNLATNATLAHIHGPAAINQTAGILVDLQPFNGGAFGTAGSLFGTATLSTTILASVVDQLTYLNIHTVPNPGGELRGHLLR
jgi:glucose/arabinose dehydrogenase